jgi:hypothetical protein
VGGKLKGCCCENDSVIVVKTIVLLLGKMCFCWDNVVFCCWEKCNATYVEIAHHVLNWSNITEER